MVTGSTSARARDSDSEKRSRSLAVFPSGGSAASRFRHFVKDESEMFILYSFYI